MGGADESGRTRAKREVVKFALKLSVILKALETWYRYSLRVCSFWLGFVPSYWKRKRILGGEFFFHKNKKVARERDSRYTLKYSRDLQKTSVASETDLCAEEGGGVFSFTVWPKFQALFCYFYRIEDVPRTDLYIHAVT
jgi:hypothetical protein